MAPGPGCSLPLLAVCGALWGFIAAASPITAQLGSNITLSCLFPSQTGMDLQRLTITWQKERAGADALVVHSFYYGKDQLERQDEAYRNRTWLDLEGLIQGNASLTLMDVHSQDEGIYHCYVFSELGRFVGTVELTVNQSSHLLAKLPGIAANSAGLGGSWVCLLGLCLVLMVPNCHDIVDLPFPGCANASCGQFLATGVTCFAALPEKWLYWEPEAGAESCPETRVHSDCQSTQNINTTIQHRTQQAQSL